MKKVLNKIVLIIAAFFACSCSGLLDQYPTTSLNPNNFWQSERDVIAAVNKLYTYLPGIDFMFTEIRTDLACHSQPGWQNAENLGSAGIATSKQYADRWIYLYKGVVSCNYFLENVHLAQSCIPKNLYSRVIGEATFMRAYLYMELVMEFGDVPYVTKMLSKQEGMEVSRTPAVEIWDAISTSLKSVVGSLPATYKKEKGRITSGACNMLLAKCMLYAGRYKEAYDAANSVIVSGNYGLLKNFEDNFTYAGENSKESILSRQYAKGSHPHDAFMKYAPIGLRKSGNCDFALTKDLADMFQMKNGKAITDETSEWDHTDPYLNRDPRMEATIFLPAYSNNSKAFVMWNDPTKRLDPRPFVESPDRIGFSKEVNATGFFAKKYSCREDMADPTNSGIDFILMRYSETLLIAAESLIELNKELDKAVGFIDQVRERAGMPGLSESGVAVTDQVALREALRQERVFELATEGWRRYDILRWKIAEKVITGTAMGMTYLDENGEEKTIFTGHTREFNPAKDYLFPIPDAERKMNPNLTQNSGY